jgi:MYXO-CTERM domain-containing protein
LFLNALFEADCVTTQGSPNIQLSVSGRSAVGANQFPVDETYSVLYVNQGQGGALDAVLSVTAPAGTEVADFEPGGTQNGNTVSWDIGSIGYHPAQPGDPPHSGTRWLTLRFLDYGDYILQSVLDYRAGASNHQAGPHDYPILVAPDRDGDGIPDDVDPFPDDPYACGDSDGDNCDDCSVSGYWDPSNDGPDSDGDGICDQAGPDGGTGSGSSDKGCGCRTADPGSEATLLFVLFALLALAFRRRR